MLDVKKQKILGVWFGFDYPIVAKREGIARYAFYLIESLLKESDVQVEIWCYAINYAAFKSLFEPLIATGRVTIHTELKNDLTPVVTLPAWAYPQTPIEKELSEVQLSGSMNSIRGTWANFRKAVALEHLKLNSKRNKQLITSAMLLANYSVLDHLGLSIWISLIIPFFALLLFLNRNLIMKKTYDPLEPKPGDVLAECASRDSKADVFLIPYVGLMNSVWLKRKKVIAVHDLITITLPEYFAVEPSTLRPLLIKNIQTLYALGMMAEQGSKFVSHCGFVLEEHCMKLVPSIKREMVTRIFLPVNVPQTQVAVNEDLKRFGVGERFVFYPTQHRPYKNIELLIEATKILNDSGHKIDLVLTASNFSDETLGKFDRAGYRKFLRIVGDLSEQELMLFHRKATCVVAPSKFEGGLPWPALEAIWVGTPVIMGDLHQTRERLEFSGVNNFEEHGILLFDVNSANDLYLQMKKLVEKPDVYRSKQASLKDKIFRYSWSDAARDYMKWLEI